MNANGFGIISTAGRNLMRYGLCMETHCFFATEATEHMETATCKVIYTAVEN